MSEERGVVGVVVSRKKEESYREDHLFHPKPPESPFLESNVSKTRTEDGILIE
jgi:hypothetical protein